MADKNQAYVYNWGAGADGSNSGVWVSAAGLAVASVTVPTGASGTYATGASGLSPVGWLDADAGIVEGHSISNTIKYAWQGGTQIKTLKNQETRTFQFSALEENAVVLGLGRPGSTVTTTAGVTKSLVKSGTGSDIRVFGLDLVYDAVTKKRIIIGNGEVTDFADVSYKYDDLTVHQYTVTCYPDVNGVYYTEYSTAPGAAVS